MKYQTILIWLIFSKIFVHQVHAADSNNIKVKPSIGFAIGKETLPISGYVVTNTETDEQVKEGTSNITTGGGFLVGLDIGLKLNSYSYVNIGYAYKFNSENPGLDWVDATFSRNIVDIYYSVFTTVKGIQLNSGIGAALHIAPKFEIVWDENDISVQSQESFSASYHHTFSPVFIFGIEKMTREGIAFNLTGKLSLLTYKGKSITFENKALNLGDPIPFDRNGAAIDITMGATWYFK